MCGSSSAPTPPPAAPAAPRAPDVSGRLGSDSDAARRRRASGESSRSTILTSARGVTDGAAVATKTLLGQ